MDPKSRAVEAARRVQRVPGLEAEGIRIQTVLNELPLLDALGIAVDGILADALMERGFNKPDYSLNKLGGEIEDTIDALNRIRIEVKSAG